MNRRELLQMSLLAGGAILAAPTFLRGGAFESSPDADLSQDPWSQLPAILDRIKPPIFPDRSFSITKFGVVADSKTDNTAAFQKAVAACAQAGGGRVVVPAGEFLTGAIELKSNVNLHVSKGATIRFTRDTGKYPLVLTRWEGVELMNYSPFIYAFKQENIAITGEGTIDGNSDCEHWWPWKGRENCGGKKGDPSQENDRNKLFDMAENGVPVSQRVFGKGHYLRPQFIQPYACRNVLIEGVSLLGSPMWQVHPVLCANVTVRGVNISAFGPNTDGCDPESCTDVLIKDCFFNTGDDCIAIKSGRNADGRRTSTPARNTVVQGCRMKDGHGGVSVGSEISGGVSNVFVENCHMDSPHLESALRIKNNAMRGGVLENIYARNIEVGQVSDAGLSIDFFYEEGQAGKFTPVVRNVELRNVKVQKADYALFLSGFKDAPIQNVRLVGCDFNDVAKPNIIENVKDISLRDVHVNGKLLAILK